MSKDRIHEAIECYDKSLKINPNDVDGWNGKGDAENQLGRYEQAIMCYDEALRINPNESTWIMKGIVLSKIKKYEEADFCYEKALAINPQNIEVCDMKKHVQVEHAISKGFDAYAEGKKFIENNKYEEAVSYFKKAIESFNGVPDTNEFDANNVIGICNSCLGICLVNIEKYEESIKYFDKAISINSDEQDNLIMKNAALRKLGKLKGDTMVNCPECGGWKGKGYFQDKYGERFDCFLCKGTGEIDGDRYFSFSEPKETRSKEELEKSYKEYTKEIEMDKDPNNDKIQKHLDAAKAKLSKNSSLKNNEIDEINKQEPLDILKMRLAKGEITLEEFNKIKDIL